MENSSSLFVMNPLTDFTRNRTFTFAETIKALLGMRGNTLNKELADYFNTVGGYATSSAFVQQRAKILPDAFNYLFHEMNEQCKHFDKHTYEGYHLYAVDGSDLNIHYDTSAESHFANGDCKGFNQLHLNCLYDVLNNTYKDCIVQPSPKTNEPQAACQMIRRSLYLEKAILLADRGYGAMNLMEHCRRNNVDFLVRVKNDWIKEISSFGNVAFDKDFSFELRQTQTKQDKLDYRQGKAKYISGQSKFGKIKKSQTWDFELPFNFTVRIVRFKKPDGEYETIATSLDRFLFPSEKLCELYHLRWSEETAFRQLKYNLALVNLHSRKEHYIMQEIFARLTMYNFCQRIASMVSIKPKRNHTKYVYRINFTMAVHLCIQFFRYRGKEPPDILSQIRRYIRPDRPGRADKRKMKTKSVAYFVYRIA